MKKSKFYNYIKVIVSILFICLAFICADYLYLYKLNNNNQNVQIDNLTNDLNIIKIEYQNSITKIDSLTRIIEKNNRLKKLFYIEALCYTHNIDMNTILSIIYNESRFDNSRISSADCIGLMQINYKVHKLDKERLLTDYKYNIRSGINIYLLCLKRAKNDKHLALKYYYGIDSYSNTYASNIQNIKKFFNI